jgi:hypothetical protein
MKNLCLLFLHMKLSIQEVNTFQDPQPLEQSQRVIALCQAELNQTQEEEQLAQKKQVATQKKIYYSDANLEKAKEVISWITERVEYLLLERQAYISSKDLRTIKERVEELKKMRMGTNYERTRDLLQELVGMIDTIQQAYFESVQDKAQPIFPESVVTDIDVQKALSVLEIVQKQQQFGGTVSAARQDYVAFGKGIVFLSFLKKDFFHRLSFITDMLYSLPDLLVLATLIVLGELSCMIASNTLFSFRSDVSSLFQPFLSLGLFGLLTYGICFLRKRDPVLLVILFLLDGGVYFLLLNLLQHSFSLG